jgi:hypothetical protein
MISNRVKGLIRRDILSFFYVYKSYANGNKDKKKVLMKMLRDMEKTAKANGIYYYYKEEFEKIKDLYGYVINFKH